MGRQHELTVTFEYRSPTHCFQRRQAVDLSTSLVLRPEPMKPGTANLGSEVEDAPLLALPANN
ncbi:hypothetical protein [Variovorax sp. RA8]|uniref:hypothetical protein n=1 Tax=Variovorax sp. (strain JCM 16519 / RA8) TaxID=662548 RepID=UPI000AF31291|nr:hypothetical protein [Variovorax sp. RA8]VTU43189.1 hypothetical protein RA8P1_00421 [Variovorax sp. RA8]